LPSKERSGKCGAVGCWSTSPTRKYGPELPLETLGAQTLMAHEIAKLLLEHAGTFLERTEAVRSALKLGMPLSEIEAYLDWLDALRSVSGKQPEEEAEEMGEES
jgi:hypothetical protein